MNAEVRRLLKRRQNGKVYHIETPTANVIYTIENFSERSIELFNRTMADIIIERARKETPS